MAHLKRLTWYVYFYNEKQGEWVYQQEVTEPSAAQAAAALSLNPQTTNVRIFSTDRKGHPTASQRRWENGKEYQ